MPASVTFACPTKPRMTTATPNAPRLDRYDAAALGALVLTLAAMLAALLGRAPDPSYWVDDGVYLVTAKSLALGDGYRHTWLPGEPFQTKYPPAWPWVLSLLWRSADLLTHHWLIPVVNGAMLLIAHVASYFTVRRLWNQPWFIAAAGAWASMTVWLWFQLIASAMSEPMFVMGVCLTTWGATTLCARSMPARRAVFIAFLTGLIGAITILTRSMGVMVVGGLGLALLLHRRWVPAAIVAAFSLSAMGGWAFWRAGAAAANKAIPQAAALGYELDYSLWLINDPAALVRVATLNLSDMLFQLELLIRPLPPGFLGWCASSGPTMLVLWGIVSVMVWLLIDGFTRSWSAARGAAHLTLILQIVMILVWPFSPQRFVAPLMPWLIPMLFIGAAAIIAPKAKGPKPRTILSLTPAQWAGVAPLTLILSLPCPQQDGATFFFPALRDRPATRAELVEKINAYTEPTAVVAAPDGPLLHLLTGRRFMQPLPNDDPVLFQFPDDRTFFGMNLAGTPGRMRYIEKMIPELERYYSVAGAGYLVFGKTGGMLEKLLADHRLREDRLYHLIGSTEDNNIYALTPRKPEELPAPAP